MPSIRASKNFANSASARKVRIFSVRENFEKCFHKGINLIDKLTNSLRVAHTLTRK